LRKLEHGGIIRELKVFGQAVPISSAPEEKWQHRGYGTRLIEECERIAKDEWKAGNLLVNSGVGAREYYRKFGYEKNATYMGKEF
jgi:elongator complex protein 3